MLNPIVRTLAVAAMLYGASTALHAQDASLAKLKPKDFPNQPIEYTVVYPAGGGLDIMARLLAKYVEKASGDRIIVNNRTGGAGMVGHSYLATQAKPDGYTLGVLANLVWGDAMLRSQGKWSHTDLEPIGYVNSDPMLWVTATDGPLKGMGLKQITQAAKDKPGTIRVVTVPGSMWDYCLDQVESATGAKFLRVPYQSGGAGISALAGGNVDVAQAFFAESRPYIDSGKMVAIGAAAPERLPHLKEVGTFNELLGGNDHVWTLIRFVVVPAKTSADRKAYLKAAVNAGMKDPEFQGELRKLGVYFDPNLANAADIAKALNGYAEREREFYKKTGRLK